MLYDNSAFNGSNRNIWQRESGFFTETRAGCNRKSSGTGPGYPHWAWGVTGAQAPWQSQAHSTRPNQSWTPFPAYTSLSSCSRPLICSHVFSHLLSSRFGFTWRRVVRCHAFLSSWTLLLRRLLALLTSNPPPHAANRSFPALLRGLLLLLRLPRLVL